MTTDTLTAEAFAARAEPFVAKFSDRISELDSNRAEEALTRTSPEDFDVFVAELPALTRMAQSVPMPASGVKIKQLFRKLSPGASLIQKLPAYLQGVAKQLRGMVDLAENPTGREMARAKAQREAPVLCDRLVRFAAGMADAASYPEPIAPEALGIDADLLTRVAALQEEPAEAAPPAAGAAPATPAAAPAPPPGVDPQAVELKKGQRHLRMALDNLKVHRPEEAERGVVRAEACLEKLEGEVRATLQGEIDDARAQITAKLRARLAEGIKSRMERLFDAARSDLEKGTRGAGSPKVGEAVEVRLREAEEVLASDDAVSSLDEESRGRLTQEIAALRERALAATADVLVSRVTEPLDRIDRAMSGDDPTERDSVPRFIQYAEDAFAQVLPGDPRRAELSERIARTRAAYEAAAAGAEKELVIQRAVNAWRQTTDAYGDRCAGWEGETGHDHETWLATGSLGLPLTQARVDVVERALTHPVLEAGRARFGDDPGVAATVAEVTAAGEAASGKVCALAEERLAGVAAESADADPRLERCLRALQDEVERHGKLAAGQAATLERIAARIAAFEERQQAAAAAREATDRALRQEAATLWSSWTEALGGDTHIDALAASRDPDAYLGRRVRLDGRQNRAGWDYEQQGYVFIAPIDGHPVGCVLDESLKAQIKAQEADTGLTFSALDIEGLVGEVVGACRIQGIEFSQLTRQHHPTFRFVAPKLRVIALRAGAFCLRAPE